MSLDVIVHLVDDSGYSIGHSYRITQRVPSALPTDNTIWNEKPVSSELYI